MFELTLRWFAVAALAVLAGCESHTKAPAPPPTASVASSLTAATTSDVDIDRLGRRVNLPVRPEAVVWQERRLGTNSRPEVPGPTDYALTAVLLYSPADAESIAASAGKLAAPSASPVTFQDWYPAALKVLAKPGPEGRATLNGQRYHADAFFRSPLINGSLTRIADTNYFVLRLFTT